MPKFDEDTMSNMPRLVIEYQRGPNNEDNFKWGMAGNINPLYLIGTLERIITTINTSRPDPSSNRLDLYEDHYFDKQGLLVVYDENLRVFTWWIGKDIPADALVGMIVIIREIITGTVINQMATAQQQQEVKILDPRTGMPIRRLPGM